MCITRSDIPNLLSLSRIPASGVFVVVFSAVDATAFWISVFIAFLALISDFLDGYLARRWSIASELGYYLDGLGDKCFTVALALVISRIYPELTIIVWAMISREVALYALRVVDPSRDKNIEQLRIISLWQAGTIRLFFLLFFILVAFKVHEIVSPEFVFPSFIIVGTAATVVGWLSILILGKRILEQHSGHR